MKVECEGNPARVKNVSCYVKAVNWNMGEVNMDCHLTVTVRNPMIRMEILRKDYSNQYQPFLVDVRMDFCNVIQKRSFVPYAVILWKILKQYSNLNHSCPFTGPVRVRNAYLDSNHLPPFPHGFYQFRFTYSDSNSTSSELIGSAKLFLQVMEPIKSKRKTVPKN
ncbi:uncharacterized protein [Drosophila takahashii]|uniref:uncharacterized protein n=1 Tax=Drosophila takahashii TaxID=29030 RepID=UPI00389944B7